MAVRRRGKGWVLDLYVPEPGRPGGRKRVRLAFPTRREALAEEGKRRGLIREKRLVEVRPEWRTSFEELAGRYEAVFRHQRSWATAKRHHVEVLRAHFGGLLLGSIDYWRLERFLAARQATPTRSGRPRAAATVNREVSCLRHMLAKAVEWGLLGRNPFSLGGRLHLRECNQRLRYLEDEAEDGRLLAACPAWLRPVVECALLSGLRRGEVLALEWGDVKDGYLHVRRSKTGRQRQVPVNPRLAAVLEGLRAAGGGRSRFVFTRQRRGRLERLEDIGAAFRGACRRAGLRDFRFHDLRHTFATRLVRRGAPLRVVQEILGHQDIKMTLRYSHLSEQDKVEAVRLIGGAG